MKKTFYTEWAYVVGIVAIALGTAFMEAADFGVSMVVAPAYLIYLKLSESLSFFTFGMAEYVFQGILLILMFILLRKFRLSYLFSFVTAIVYGLVLDGLMLAVSFIPSETIPVRILLYLAGMFVCSVGVSMMFHTYIAPEVYEMFVKEVAEKYHLNINKFKTGYDCVSCAVGVILSFAFFGFGHFEGVKWGTIVCALVNGWIIGRCSAFFEKRFTFRDGLKLRKLF